MNYLGANMKLIVECSQKLVQFGENLWGKEQKLDKAEPLDVPTMTTEFIKEIGGLVEEEALKQYEVPTGSIKIWDLPDGYQFTDENGNVINATKIVLEKKKKEYPKTFEECCKILGLLNVDLCFNADYRSFDASKEQWKRLGLMNQFYQLLICRDAYWQIAGAEMGLDKPWKPDYDSGVNKFGIICLNGVVQESNPATNWERHLNKILDFPTAEMRDAFYENFKELIESVKELL